MLRLFGILVRLAFGLQIAIIVFVAMSIALINEAYLRHTASTLLPSGSMRKAA